MKLFKTDELVQWKQLTSMCEKELRDGLPGSKATGVFDRKSDGGNKCWDDFRKRVVEHVSFCLLDCCNLIGDVIFSENSTSYWLGYLRQNQRFGSLEYLSASTEKYHGKGDFL